MGNKNFVIEAPDTVSITINGTDEQFPVRRVYCLARNYRAHAEEMGDDPDQTPPFFFLKPADAVVPASDGFEYPSATREVHYEMELVVALNNGGTNIAEDNALDCVFGYGLGLDMTRRDLQGDAKKRGLPWDAAKSADGSAPVSPLRPVADVGHLTDHRIWLSVNDEIRQDSTTAAMRWSVAKSISVLSGYFELFPGDLLFTGTPAGVGPVERGDILKGGVDGLGEFEVLIK